MKKPTRFYSNRQEKQIAKTVGGKQVSNSGATPFYKGDVLTDDWLIEAKTVTKEQRSFSIQKSWLDKNKEEAFAMNKKYSALAINFGPDAENYYVVDERTFKRIVELFKIVETMEGA